MYIHKYVCTPTEYVLIYTKTGAFGVMAIVVGNGSGDPSSNPGRVCLHFIKN